MTSASSPVRLETLGIRNDGRHPGSSLVIRPYSRGDILLAAGAADGHDVAISARDAAHPSASWSRTRRRAGSSTRISPWTMSRI